jgi:hypothetical protein
MRFLDIKHLVKRVKLPFYMSGKTRRQLFMTLVMAAALPIGAYLVQRAQYLRSQAAPGNATLAIVPGSVTKNIGESGSFDVFLNPGGERVTGVEMYITYDPALVDITGIAAGPFFTDPSATVGMPLEIVKTFGAGKISYAAAFPLGSNYSSVDAKNAVKVQYTAKAQGTVNFAFITSGTPMTLVTDINAQNVMASATGGVLNIGNLASGARLYFSTPRPANPQTLRSSFDIDILMDTGGQNADGVDVKAKFDKSVLQVVSLAKAIGNGLPSYPQATFDNTTGTILISANTGSGSTARPVNGTSIWIATLKMTSVLGTTGTPMTFDFVAGSRNDSNIVLSGTSSTGDPTDILASVTHSNIVVTGSTATGTPTPTVTPLPTNSPTPISTTATGGLISNLVVNDSLNAAEWSIQNNLQVGNNQYGDRTFKIAQMPSSLAGSTWIRTANDSKQYETGSVATFRVNSNATVYVIHDDRLTTKPSWLSTFTNTGLKVVNDEPAPSTVFTVFSKTFTSGSTVTLGINGIGDSSMYTVVAKPATVVTNNPTPTTVVSTPTSTPVVTATLPSPTSSLPRSILVKFAFQGITRTGTDKTKSVILSYKPAAGGTVSNVNLTTSTNGEASLSLAPGDYLFLVKSSGYLPGLYGTTTTPVRITSTTGTIDLSQSPLRGGDFNGDGTINEIDYTAYFLTNFRSTNATVDLDGSREVNNLDFGIMRTNWGLLGGSI